MGPATTGEAVGLGVLIYGLLTERSGGLDGIGGFDADTSVHTDQICELWYVEFHNFHIYWCHSGI